MPWDDHVLPHGDLECLTPGLWHVQGTLKHQPLPRAMAVYRMPDGRLWLHSAIALDDARRTELEALGPIGVLLVPSGMHRLDAAVYKERYPEAQVVCPSAARAAVEKVVAIDAVAEDVLDDLGVRCHRPPGLKPDELVYELPLDDGVALVFCDALFNLDELPGCAGRIAGWMGSTGFFGTTFIGRMFLADKAGWKGWLLDQSNREDVRVIHVAHGEPITRDCSRRLREAGERL